MLKNSLDVRVGEEIRRAVRTVEHADFPGVRVGGNQRRRAAPSAASRAPDVVKEVQHVAGAQGAAGVAAELAEDEGRAAAEIVRHIEAAAHGEVGAGAGAAGAVRRRV